MGRRIARWRAPVAALLVLVLSVSAVLAADKTVTLVANDQTGVGVVYKDIGGGLFSQQVRSSLCAKTSTECDTVLSAVNGGQLVTTWKNSSGIEPVLGSAATLTGTSGTGALLEARPGEWSVLHGPAANAQATVTRAAGGAGVRHVVTSISATAGSNGTAPTATQVALVLRDGATGSGTIVWQGNIGITATAGDSRALTASGLNIVLSANTATTLEFTGAGGLNTFETVAMTGYDVS